MAFLFKSLAAIAGVWILLSAGLLALMRLPPERFAAAMARVPAPVLFAAVPFEPLWNFARAGNLRTGDPAPDFDLRRLDGNGRVRLSDFGGTKPIVLVFGSYT